MSEHSPTDLPFEDAEDLYQNAPCGYLSTNSSGIIVRMNRTLLTWLGYDPSELVGHTSFYELLTVGGRMYYEMHCAPLLQMQGMVREVALELRCKDRRKIPVLINASAHRTEAGAAGSIRITIFDATDRRKYEQELLQARVRAEEADQTKAAFIATVSHEIRSPLGAIMAAQHLLEKTELTEQQRKFVAMLRSSSTSILELLNGVLDLGKLDAGRVELLSKPIEIRALLKSTLDALRARAEEKNLPLDLSVDSAVPETVLGDPIKIRQILTNLITNAIKFTDAGWINVAVECEMKDTHSALIRFAVSDSGIGIAADQLGSIFDPYAQTRTERVPRYGGTGLGLAVSKKLVELYGGGLHVTSEPGKGSTFSFALRLSYGL